MLMTLCSISIAEHNISRQGSRCYNESNVHLITRFDTSNNFNVDGRFFL
jgi:hypothetical protein